MDLLVTKPGLILLVVVSELQAKAAPGYSGSCCDAYRIRHFPDFYKANTHEMHACLLALAADTQDNVAYPWQGL